MKVRVVSTDEVFERPSSREGMMAALKERGWPRLIEFVCPCGSKIQTGPETGLGAEESADQVHAWMLEHYQHEVN
jgi:hypothetical protein